MRAGSHCFIDLLDNHGPYVRLVVAGELDIAGVPALAHALREQRAAGRHVLLDLGPLRFIDSSGMHAVRDAAKTAEVDGWNLRIDARLSAPARRAFEVAGLITDLPLVED
jgi:anti-anti-sigma factor